MAGADTHPWAEYERAVAACEALLRPSTGPISEDVQHQHLLRMGHFLARLGNPQKRFPALHIAGTSGKGSTTAMIAAILRAAGLRTGSHMKPYLQTDIERTQVGVLYISPADFTRLIREMWPHVTYMQDESPFRAITYREIAIAQSFLHFAQTQVQIAAVETGMGGRYDATNYVNSLITAITTVDYDHVAALGPSLERIAYHKAGIIKDGVPVIVGAARPEALAVIAAEATRRQAPLFRLGREIHYIVRRIGRDGSLFDYQSPWGRLEGVRVGLLGEHQVANAAMALAVAQALGDLGWPISEAAIRQGLLEARLPCRLEVMAGDPTVVLDGAHNPEKMRSLAGALCALYQGRRLVLVLGVLAAKQATDILAEVRSLGADIVVTAPTVLDKPALPPEQLAALCRQAGLAARVEADLGHAIEAARTIAGAGGVVCVTGSLYMAGQARELWVPTSAILAQRTSFPNM